MIYDIIAEVCVSKLFPPSVHLSNFGIHGRRQHG